MYLLHIGRHKSGTSSLQRFLAKHRDQLRSLGIDYPQLGGPGANDIAHHGITRVLRAHERDGLDDAAVLARVQREVDGFTAAWNRGGSAAPGAPAVLLSSEAFQNCRPEQVARLLAPDRTRVVVYLREQVDYVVSAYCQKVHAQLETRTLDEYAVAKADAVDYHRFISNWADVFGMSNLHVRIYDRDALVGGDVRIDFVDALGLPVDTFHFEDADQNPSIGGELLRLKCSLNRVLAPRVTAAEARQALYRPFQQLARAYPEFRTKPPISSALQRRIRERHRPPNREVSGMIGKGTALFAERDLSGGARPGVVTRTTLEHVLDEVERFAPSFFAAHVAPVRDQLNTREA